jgi:predicted nucleic acid-binding protein
MIGVTPKNEQFTKELLTQLTILSLKTDVTQTAANVYNQLKRENNLIGVADLLIAATSLTYEIPLSTLNKKHFSRINGLQFAK